MREAQEVEGLRFAAATAPPIFRRIAAELNDARLVGMQRQSDPCESLAQLGQKPLCFLAMLEPSHEVIGEAYENHLARSGMSQTEAAKLFGVTQPRVSDRMRGKINLLALDTLVNMATAAGLQIEMHVREAA
jgi:predicted XRE-type DNA-binding protein